MKERDTQRSKLYAAEKEALTPFETSLPTVQDIERYLKRQSNRERLRSRYGYAYDITGWKLQVGDGRGTRRAYAHGTGKITIPLWARKDWIVLHEWAHIIHERIGVTGFGWAGSRNKELRGGACHGWQYAAIYLDLVRFCMGAEAEKALKASFKKHRVRFRPKAKRQLSPEHRAKLVVAAERARAARSQ